MDDDDRDDRDDHEDRDDASTPLLLTVAQVSHLIGYARSKVYDMARDPDDSFPGQACRGRWRRSDVERWVAGLGPGDTP